MRWSRSSPSRPDAAGVIAAAAITDTVKRAREPRPRAGEFPRGGPTVAKTESRDHLWAAQTPQVFRTDALRDALAADPQRVAAASDDAMLVEKAGGRVLIEPAPGREPEGDDAGGPADRRGAARRPLAVGIFDRFRLGDGSLKPELRAELEAEGLVLVEEGCWGTIRYDHFKAPGKRFHGKVTGERIGLGISEKRFVVYCRSGQRRARGLPVRPSRGWRELEISVEDSEKVMILIDYARLGEPSVEGTITIRAKTPRAAEIVDQLAGPRRPDLDVARAACT